MDRTETEEEEVGSGRSDRAAAFPVPEAREQLPLGCGLLSGEHGEKAFPADVDADHSRRCRLQGLQQVAVLALHLLDTGKLQALPELLRVGVFPDVDDLPAA